MAKNLFQKTSRFPMRSWKSQTRATHQWAKYKRSTTKIVEDLGCYDKWDREECEGWEWLEWKKIRHLESWYWDHPQASFMETAYYVQMRNSLSNLELQYEITQETISEELYNSVYGRDYLSAPLWYWEDLTVFIECFKKKFG